VSKRPWFPFCAQDWLIDPHLRSCTPEERGILIDMMCYAHDGDPYGYLTNAGQNIDLALLAFMLRVDQKWLGTVTESLHQKHVLESTDDHCWFIPRMVKDGEARTVAEFHGKRGGNPALKGGDKDPLKLRAEQSRAEQSKEAFGIFWSEYPRKVARKKAEAAFAKHDCHLVMPKLMEALTVQKASRQWRRDNGDFVPHPSTWINQARWEDDPASYRSATREANIV